MKVMIFAAGLGTRFKPWTDNHPKALAVINGKSLLQRNIEWLQRYGITEVIVNVHHFADQVLHAIDLNNGWGSKIEVSDETGLLLETGGGLLKAKHFFNDGPFILANADILTDLNLDAMIKQHHSSKPLATLAVTNRKSSRYFLFDEQNSLRGWENTQTGERKIFSTLPLTQKAFSGIHVIDPKIFMLKKYIPQQEKFSMVDWYLAIAGSTKTEEAIMAFDHSGGKLVDVGKPAAVAEAEALFP